MKHYLFILTTLFIAGCSTIDSVEMTRTIDLLEHIGLPYTDTGVTGFSINNGELYPPIVTEATWVGVPRILPAAGFESTPCNDGNDYRLRQEGSSGFGYHPGDLLVVNRIVGDTGGADISPDRSCGCDTHIKTLTLNGITLEPQIDYSGIGGFSLGKEDLCPNRLDDLVLGDGEFDGPVEASLSATLRVEAGRLLLDIHYYVVGVP